MFRHRPDGSYVIEAAMFFLPTGTELSTIPDDLAWLPGWHTHDELCMDGHPAPRPTARVAQPVSAQPTFTG